MILIRNVFLFITVVLIAACSSTPAPVIDRAPSPTSSKQSSVKPTGKSVTKSSSVKSGGDWRPDTYTVKKGDTLFSIGLEYGYDYKEIARANNIPPPYVIRVGQTLKMDSLKESGDSKAGNTPNTGNAQSTSAEQSQSSEVTTYALDNESSDQSSVTAALARVAVNITEPKATREAYSVEAMNKPIAPEKAATAVNAKTTADSKAAVEPKSEPQTASQTAAEVGGIGWSWPTKGKVIAGFNEAGNKGIDIAGSKGQPIQAAAAGKVIYSGSDLRGYGKLVIIKHNSTYLSVYANNSNILVKEGQQVSAGQKIAEMGDSDSNVVKLHFEIRQQGKSVDPMKFLAAN